MDYHDENDFLHSKSKTRGRKMDETLNFSRHLEKQFNIHVLEGDERCGRVNIKSNTALYSVYSIMSDFSVFWRENSYNASFSLLNNLYLYFGLKCNIFFHVLQDMYFGTKIQILHFLPNLTKPPFLARKFKL